MFVPFNFLEAREILSGKARAHYKKKLTGAYQIWAPYVQVPLYQVGLYQVPLYQVPLYQIPFYQVPLYSGRILDLLAKK